MKKSINAGFFPASYTYESIFNRLVQNGFSAVELNMTAEKTVSPSLYFDVTDSEVLEIKALLEKYSLECCGIVTDKLWTYHLTSDDRETRNNGMAYIRKMIHIASLLDSGSVLIVPGVINEKVTYKNGYANALSCMRSLAPEAEKAGVLLGIENVWNKFLLSPYEMAGFVDSTGSANVGVYFDVGNVVVNSYPEYWIEILGKRITRVHVKGFDSNKNAFCYLNEGTINWENVMAELVKCGYTGCITAELWPRGTNIDEDFLQISKDLDNLLALTKQ